MALALAAVVWLVYANALHGPFVFDDWHVIGQNPAIRSFGNIPSYFADTSKFSLLEGNRDYRPLMLLSAALAWWAGGGSTLPFHAISISLHALNVVLVFLGLRLLLEAAPRAGATATRPPAERDWVAMLGALLFAVHPLATESVDYIVQQSVPMTACFYLLAFDLFLAARGRRRAAQRPGRLLLAGSVLAYFLALLSKPIAITLPLNLLLWDVLFGGARSGAGSGAGDVTRSGVAGSDRRTAWRRHAARWLTHLPYWLASLLYVWIRSQLFARPVGSVTDAVRPYAIHALTQTKAMTFYYLKLSVWPAGLNADLAYPVSSSIRDPAVLAALAIMLLVAVALVRLRRHRLLVFWTLWFPICLLVTTYLAVLGQVVNEHRVYLSLVGVCAVGALGIEQLWRLLAGRAGRRAARALLVAVTAAVVVALALGTRARNEVWGSELALWEDAARQGNNYRAHMNYGLALEAAGRAGEALGEFERAVELAPLTYPHMNLGLAYAKRGDFERGLWHLREAVRLWPSLPETHYYLGVGLDLAGQEDEAEAELRGALDLRPDYIRANRYLARFYEQRDQPEQALAVYRVLLASDPAQQWVAEKIDALERGGTGPAEQLRRAQEARRRGDTRGALAILEEARRQHPDDAGVLFNLGFLQQKAGTRAAAIDTYERLLRVAPGHRQGHFNLAYAYLEGDSREDWSRAAALFERTLEIDPSYDEALFREASACWKLGDTARARDYDRRYLERPGHAELRAVAERRLAGGGSDNP